MKTAMQELKEDLFDTLTTSKEALEEIKEKSKAKEIYEYVEATLKLIIQEIENDYILKEKNQIIEARVKKPLELEWLEAEQYYNETFKK
jgi:cell division ATPase FtsA